MIHTQKGLCFINGLKANIDAFENEKQASMAKPDKIKQEQMSRNKFYVRSLCRTTTYF